MDNSKVLMTKSSLLKLENEITELKSVQMRECLQNLADAKDKGDIAENAEYDIAKEQLENLQLRIKAKESVLKRVVLVDENSIDISKVGILTKVTLENLTTNTKVVYSLVPENEIDIKGGKISVNSPIAKSILNKSEGDEAEFIAPAGTFKLKVLKIENI